MKKKVRKVKLYGYMSQMLKISLMGVILMNGTGYLYKKKNMKI